MKIAFTSVLMLGGLLSGYADAGTNPSVNWSIAGAACQLETGSSTVADVRANTGEVAFQTGKTGTIRLICPVSGLFPSDIASSPSKMDVVFYDQDGTTDNCYVQAYLKYNTRGTGETFGSIAAYDDSSDGTLVSSTPFRNLESTTFSHTWDFDSYFYWVEVVLVRNVTTCQSALETVTLSSQVL